MVLATDSPIHFGCGSRHKSSAQWLPTPFTRDLTLLSPRGFILGLALRCSSLCGLGPIHLGVPLSPGHRGDGGMACAPSSLGGVYSAERVGTACNCSRSTPSLASQCVLSVSPRGWQCLHVPRRRGIHQNRVCWRLCRRVGCSVRTYVPARPFTGVDPSFWWVHSGLPKIGVASLDRG